MKIVFFGTGDFSQKILSGIIDAGNDVIAVVCQPDKVNARNNKIIPSQIKLFCQKLNIPLYQFNRLNLEGEVALKALNPDLFITASYGQIIKQNILDIPKYGTVNVHASLLPKYRGPAPIQWAIANGEKQTGITIMRTELGVDTGAMYLQKKIDILPEDTASSIFDKLAILGVECINEFLSNPDLYLSNPISQDEKKMSYYPMIKKEDYLINFNDVAFNICNKIRAFENCFFIHNGCRYKVGFAVPNERQGQVGEVLVANGKLGFIVACKDRAIEIVTIQPEGKQKMFALAYMNSNKFKVGDIIENT